ncbi:MAG: SusD/RagB family nutrient-binding outer membrane lipoprotein [Cyclobacteriaceae bacterium]
MKYIHKLILVLALGFGFSCENMNLDLQDNPNAITPESASLNDLYNAVSGQFMQVFLAAENMPGQAARMYHAAGYSYPDFTTPESLNGLWNTYYAGFAPDADALLSITDEKGFDVHGGTARIMQGYAMMMLVDVFGNVPNSQSNQGTDIIAPASDPGADVYAAAIALIDQGIAQLEATDAAAPAYDNYYGGDTDQWIKLGNSVKLRAALNTGDAGTINSLVSGGNIITDAADDFAFSWGNQRNNPNSRNPYYYNHYEIGDGDYLSNYYMWLLRAEKVDANDIPVVDPRIRYYFYRKIEDGDERDITEYSCHFSEFPVQTAKPAHWDAVDPRIPYCIPSGDGYFGRDHLNGEGIPPDGPVRSSYGLYPFGGDFDDNSFDDTREGGTRGGLGQGISPIMLSSFVDFMRAEAALSLGTNDDAEALLESGIRKSMAKVFSFESLVSSKMGTTVTLRDGSSGTIKDLYGSTDADVDDYVDFVIGEFQAANAAERLDIVVKEYYIAAWGNGLEAYNMYRRTGSPSNMQPSLEPNPESFPYSFFLPAQHVTRNGNVSQKELSERVFWNTGGPELW